MSILERLFDYKRKFQKQGIITLRHSKLLSCSQLLSCRWPIKNEISKSVGKTKHREMYGKLLVLTTIRSNIMFNSYLCARVRKGSKNISLKRNVFGDLKRYRTRIMVSQWNGNRNHKVQTKSMKEKTQVVLAFLFLLIEWFSKKLEVFANNIGRKSTLTNSLKIKCNHDEQRNPMCH